MKILTNILVLFFNCNNLKFFIIHEDSQLKYLSPTFIGNTKVEEIFIPENVTAQWGCFARVPSLKSIRLHESNKNYKLYESCLYSYDFNKFYWAPFIYDKQISFHPMTKTLAKFAFVNSNYTFDIVVPDTVTQLEDYTFNSCNVPKIIFSKSFRSILSFWGTTSTIILPNDLTKFSSGMFQ